MKLPAFLEGIPQTALILAVPVLAFLVTVGISLGTSGGGNDAKKAAAPTGASTLQAAAPSATATRAPTQVPTPAVTATAQPNRADCNRIRGTAYQSDAERDWFNKNCTGTSTTSTATGAASATGPSTTTAAANTAGSSSPATGSAPAAAAAVAKPIGVEYNLGARLIIRDAGVDAVVTGMDVGESGAMPDPAGYFNAVKYNFPYYPGLGGRNIVLAGHVDCGRCYNGGSGTAVFWSVRSIPVGATAQYVEPNGKVRNFVVSASYAVPDGTDFSGIVADGAAAMTIITCTGTFSAGHYDNRHVVAFTEV